MSLPHVIAIERPAKVSVSLGRILLAVEGSESVNPAAQDVGLLILDHPQIVITHGAMRELMSAGAAVIFTDGAHMPVCVASSGNMEGAERPFLQAELLGSDLSKSWWAQVVQGKIRGQAATLRLVGRVESALRLERIAGQVKPGDPANAEAQAARVYWGAYFASMGLDARRTGRNAKDPVNATLNYAYAIMRAAVARSLAGAGLCLNFGIGHCRKDNPHNLAEDFHEPFRYLADRAARLALSQGAQYPPQPATKRLLLQSMLEADIELEGRSYRFFQGIEAVTQHFCRCLKGGGKRLLLPHAPPGRGPKLQLPDLPQAEVEDFDET